MSNSFATPWTVACEAPLGFLRKEYWSELPFLYPGDISDQGIKPESLAPSVLAGELFTTESLGSSSMVSSKN